MPSNTHMQNNVLDVIVELLDIPKAYYEKASARHQSVGEWLCRRESTLAALQPYVSPQGSFRYGTVIRPLVAAAEYDLDNVTMLALSKTDMTQKQLKHLYGAEIKEYATAHGMLAPVEEKNRCWRLVYSDEVRFHLDTLPCVPEEEIVIQAIMSCNVPRELADRAVAITDKRHPQYAVITRDLLSSNPRGFAEWFEARARPLAVLRIRELVDRKLYASVEDVPPYEWKTPLQRSIQILKRHRDVMFRDHPALGPISMIVTNLAARAYGGETDLWAALTNIVEKMPQYVSPTVPRVPNPANSAEDYADKWSKDPRLEAAFWTWHMQVKADIYGIPASLAGKTLLSDLRTAFRVELTDVQLRQLEQLDARVTPVTVYSTPSLYVPTAPPLWSDRA
jgi:hypothetical protein